jgi:hypothetical protein
MPLHTHDRNGRSGRANDPPVLILTSLASGPKHGYALLLDIETFAGVSHGLLALGKDGAKPYTELISRAD